MREFDKKQKVAIVALGGVAIFAFLGAYWQLQTHLAKPFDTGDSVSNKQSSFICQGKDCQQNDLSSLMTQQDEAMASGTSVASSALEIPDRLKGTSTVASTASSSINLSSLDQGQTTALQNILSGQGDAASIRALMIQGGADPNMLKQISDQDLIKIYQESLTQATADQGATGSDAVASSSTKK